MKKETYQRIVTSAGKSRSGVLILYGVDKLIVISTIIGYLLFFVAMFSLQDYVAVYHGLLVPAIGFAGVSLFRRWYPSRRPYEDLDIQPLIPKETKGRSFPSRHVFSIFMVGMTYLQLSVEVAIGIFLLGIVLGVIRVVAGLHYIKDVTAGAFMAILIGTLGYFVIF